MHLLAIQCTLCSDQKTLTLHFCDEGEYFITCTNILKKETENKSLSELSSEECNNDTLPALGVSSIAHPQVL